MPSSKTILTPEREALGRVLFTLRPWRTLWESRRVIHSLTQRRLQERFRGSVLGAVWVFLLPLLMLAVFSVVFVGMLKFGGDTKEQQIAAVFRLFCGLIVWNMFNETVARSASCIVSQPQFVKKIVFPLDALPVVSFAESLVLATASLGILLLGMLVVQQQVLVTWLLLPLPLALLAMLSIGLGWLLAAVGVFVRDLQQVLTVALQMLFFLTPIFYEPTPLQLLLNPVAAILEVMRDVMLRGQLPSAPMVLGLAVGGLLCMQVGHTAFLLMRRRFADVL